MREFEKWQDQQEAEGIEEGFRYMNGKDWIEK